MREAAGDLKHGHLELGGKDPLIICEDANLEAASRATLLSRDTNKVMRYMNEIEAGNVWVNDPIIDNLAGPFGGMKRSGIELELGIEGFEEFTETKHVHWDYANQIKSWWYPLE